MADDFSHECVQIGVDYAISGEYVTRLLDQSAWFSGYPLAVRTDDGPEFTSRAFIAWAESHGIRQDASGDARSRCEQDQAGVPVSYSSTTFACARLVYPISPRAAPDGMQAISLRVLLVRGRVLAG